MHMQPEPGTVLMMGSAGASGHTVLGVSAGPPSLLVRNLGPACASPLPPLPGLGRGSGGTSGKEPCEERRRAPAAARSALGSVVLPVVASLSLMTT